ITYLQADYGVTQTQDANQFVVETIENQVSHSTAISVRNRNAPKHRGITEEHRILLSIHFNKPRVDSMNIHLVSIGKELNEIFLVFYNEPTLFVKQFFPSQFV